MARLGCINCLDWSSFFFVFFLVGSTSYFQYSRYGVSEYSVQRVLFQLVWLLLFPVVWWLPSDSCYFRSRRRCVPAGRELLFGLIRLDKVRDVTSARWHFGTSGLARQGLFILFLPGLRVLPCLGHLSLLFSGVMSCPSLGIRRNSISHLAWGEDKDSEDSRPSGRLIHVTQRNMSSGIELRKCVKLTHVNFFRITRSVYGVVLCRGITIFLFFLSSGVGAFAFAFVELALCAGEARP